MQPFVTIGPFTFASYGLLMVTGLFVGYQLLCADLQRRRLQIDPRVVIASIGLAGLLSSKLYLAIENPARFLADPGFLLNRSGYTFYGAVFGGIGVVFVLARVYRLRSLTLFDSVSPGAAIGYGIGRLGCLMAGDGDYGIQTALPWGMSFPHGLVPTLVRVHPTPVYEFLLSAGIAIYLWRLGRRRMGDPHAAGEVFAQYLVLTGAARFLVEFIKLNPPVLWGLGNAQCVALLSMAGGIALCVVLRTGPRGPRVAPWPGAETGETK